MDLNALFPSPDARKFGFSPKLDVIEVFSPGPTRITKPDARYRQERWNAGGVEGIRITVQDPTRRDMDFLAREVPGGSLHLLEVSLDLMPKGKPTREVRRDLLFDLRNWIVSRLYPWKGAGIQVANRASRKLGESEPVFEGERRRRPVWFETLYLGHADSKWADTAMPNFASMRIYIKVTDRGAKPIPDAKTRTRMEVTLTAEGCRHYRLASPADLIGFKFRELRHYFLIAKPRISAPVSPLLLRRRKKLANLIKMRKESIPLRLIADVGMHALSEADPKVVRSITGDGPVNKRVLEALDNLTRSYRTSAVPTVT